MVWSLLNLPMLTYFLTWGSVLWFECVQSRLFLDLILRARATRRWEKNKKWELMLHWTVLSNSTLKTLMLHSIVKKHIFCPLTGGDDLTKGTDGADGGKSWRHPRENVTYSPQKLLLTSFQGMSLSRPRRTICFSTVLQMILAKLHFRWLTPLKKISINDQIPQLMSKISSIIRTNLDIRRDIPLLKVKGTISAVKSVSEGR